MKWTVEPKVIGVKNGVYQVELLQYMYSKLEYERMTRYFSNLAGVYDRSYPDFDPTFHFKKLKSAKCTDFMAFSPYLVNCEFLVSNTVSETLRKFHVQDCLLFDSCMYTNDNVLISDSYKMLFFVRQGFDIVDFSKCTFLESRLKNASATNHIFNNSEEYQLYIKKQGFISVNRLALNGQFDSTLDMFATRMTSSIFVSERLKKELEQQKVTGIEFKSDIEVLI